MKKVYTYLFLTAFLLGVAAKSADAQVVAVGHASAEVVESVSASSSAVTFLTLNTSSNSINDISNYTSNKVLNTSANAKNLNLGEFKITSTGTYIYNVIVEEAVAKDTNGNNLVVETSTSAGFSADNQIVESNNRVVLKGKVKLSDNQTTGTYSGSYKMVFAYN